MKKNIFINRKVIFTEFYLNYKILLVILVWSAVYSAIFIFINAKKPYYIAPTAFIEKGKIHNNQSCLSGAGSYTNSTVAFIVSSFLALILINVKINNEFANGKLRLWLTSPYSKEQILYAKILFIWSVMFATFIFQFLYQLYLSFLSADFSKYIGLVIFKELNFLIFKLVLASIILLISAALVQKAEIAMAINIIFIIGIFIAGNASNFFNLNTSDSWYKYLLLDNLSNTDCLSFRKPIISINNSSLVFGSLIKTNAWLKAFIFIINFSLVIGITIASVKIYKRKDANLC